MTNPNDCPNTPLLKALDHSMRNVFGATGALTVYHHLEEKFSLELNSIPENPLLFTQGLKEMCGELAADVIESLLVKDLSNQLGMDETAEVKRLANFLDEYRITSNTKSPQLGDE